MKKLISPLFCATLFFAACGDDVTQVNENLGAEPVESFEKLDKCGDSNIGRFVYVYDSEKVYACTKKGWVEFNGTVVENAKNGSDGSDGKDGADGKDGKDGKNGSDGKDGKNGADGKDGSDGKDGTSCTVSELDDGTGFNVICGGEILGVLKNGADGKKGAKGDKGDPGEAGTSCSVAKAESSNDVVVTCGKESVTIHNGIDGAAGKSCTMKENGNGFDVYCDGSDKPIGSIKNGNDGADGKSAYELSGYKGSLEDWLKSLKGENGKSCTVKENKQKNGYDIDCNGNVVTVTNGTDGADGKSAYELSGFNGSPEEWLKSLKGDDGKNCTVKENKQKKGYDIDCNGNVVTVTNGSDGADGKSAYEIAKDNGFTGTEKDWLEYLKGHDGSSCTTKSTNDGVEVSCSDGTKTTIKNGAEGAGCEIEDNGDGVVTLVCGKGDKATRTELYKAVCGSTPYDPTVKFCSPNYELFSCGNKPYDPETAECKMCGETYYTTDKQLCDDRDNRLYKIVTISMEAPTTNYFGVWMAENLNYETEEGSTCYCDKEPCDNSFCDMYGRLYSWESATAEGQNGKDICPVGYHLPNNKEWTALINALGDNNVGSFENASSLLRSTTGWYSDKPGDVNGSDSYGFNALPGGHWDGKQQKFMNWKFYAVMWSKSEYEYSSDEYVYALYLRSNAKSQLTTTQKSFNDMNSVRCIKDYEVWEDVN